MGKSGRAWEYAHKKDMQGAANSLFLDLDGCVHFTKIHGAVHFGCMCPLHVCMFTGLSLKIYKNIFKGEVSFGC